MSWKEMLARSIARNDEGVTLVEYGIALLLAVTVSTVLLQNLAAAVNTNLNSAGTTMT